MKIVLLKNVKYDYEAIREIREPLTLEDYVDEEHIQIGEVIDVEFPMIPEVDLISKKIEVIDIDIKKAKAGLHLLERARAELLAIPYTSEGE